MEVENGPLEGYYSFLYEQGGFHFHVCESERIPLKP